MELGSICMKICSEFMTMVIACHSYVTVHIKKKDYSCGYCMEHWKYDVFDISLFGMVVFLYEK